MVCAEEEPVSTGKHCDAGPAGRQRAQEKGRGRKEEDALQTIGQIGSQTQLAKL